MNQPEAIAAAKNLVGPAVSAQLSDPDWEWASGRSLTWDDQGLRPGEAGYVATYDEYWTAAEATSLVALRSSATGTPTRLVVDGDTIEASPASYSQMVASFRAMSSLAPYMVTPALELGTVYVPQAKTGFVPTSTEMGN